MTDVDDLQRELNELDEFWPDSKACVYFASNYRTIALRLSSELEKCRAERNDARGRLLETQVYAEQQRIGNAAAAPLLRDFQDELLRARERIRRVEALADTWLATSSSVAHFYAVSLRAALTAPASEEAGE